MTVFRNYVDHFWDKIEDITPFLDGPAAPVGMKEKERKTFMVFPVKIFCILEEHPNIISWDIHGRSFQITNTSAFEDVVMPRYFHSNSFATFIRQIYHYSFKRLLASSHCHRFCHEMFLKGRPDLLQKITRSPTTLNVPQGFDLSPFPPCRKLRPEEVQDLCVDPVLNPSRMFEFAGPVAAVAACRTCYPAPQLGCHHCEEFQCYLLYLIL